MSKKLRLVGWQIQPVLFADDGETLDPVQVDPIMVRDLASFDADLALAKVRETVEATK